MVAAPANRPDCGRRVARPAQAPSDPGGADGIAMVVACVGMGGMIAADSRKWQVVGYTYPRNPMLTWCQRALGRIVVRPPMYRLRSESGTAGAIARAIDASRLDEQEGRLAEGDTILGLFADEGPPAGLAGVVRGTRAGCDTDGTGTMNTPGAGASDAGPSEPLKDLVVDDEPAMVGALGALLGQAGHRIIAAYDGEEALRRFRDDEPDLVLLDLAMPGMDGAAVCRRIREVSDTPSSWSPVSTTMPPPSSSWTWARTTTSASRSGPTSCWLACGPSHGVPGRVRASQAWVTLPATSWIGERPIRWQGSPLPITVIEFRLLQAMIERLAEVVTHDDLLAAGWPTCRTGAGMAQAAPGPSARETRSAPGPQYRDSMEWATAWTPEPRAAGQRARRVRGETSAEGRLQRPADYADGPTNARFSTNCEPCGSRGSTAELATHRAGQVAGREEPDAGTAR